MKRLIGLILIFCLALSAASADPLAIPEDYENVIDQPFDEGNPDSGRFYYSYRCKCSRLHNAYQ